MDSETIEKPTTGMNVPAGFDELLTVMQAAKAIGAGRTKMFRMLKNNRIPSLKIEGSRRIKSSDVRAYLEGLMGTEAA